METASSKCIYCPNVADSIEHPLIAALGEFDGAPLLENRICTRCNNNQLGRLDEQYSRCGPEAFLRRHYGIQGRSKHRQVNPFYRGSAGGHRLEMLAYDEMLGTHVLMEGENGQYKQLRQFIITDNDGDVHYLSVPEDADPRFLREQYDSFHIANPSDIRLVAAPDEIEYMEALAREIWPSMTMGERSLLSATYNGAVTTVTVSNRYFRAVAKMGFHYFLTQFPDFSGAEPMFADIRQFIFDDDAPSGCANDFITRRNHPIIVEMLRHGARPAGWRAHILAAEINHGECLAQVQTFLTEDWPAPIYTVHLGRPATVPDRAAAHRYIYYPDGPKGKYAGEACSLRSTRIDMVAPPPSPAIRYEK
jgi:hypothetical protein